MFIFCVMSSYDSSVSFLLIHRSLYPNKTSHLNLLCYDNLSLKKLIIGNNRVVKGGWSSFGTRSKTGINFPHRQCYVTYSQRTFTTCINMIIYPNYLKDQCVGLRGICFWKWIIMFIIMSLFLYYHLKLSVFFSQNENESLISTWGVGPFHRARHVVSTIAQIGQTKHWLQRGPFTFLRFLKATLYALKGRGIQLVAICSLTTRCH